MTATKRTTAQKARKGSKHGRKVIQAGPKTFALTPAEAVPTAVQRLCADAMIKGQFQRRQACAGDGSDELVIQPLFPDFFNDRMAALMAADPARFFEALSECFYRACDKIPDAEYLGSVGGLCVTIADAVRLFGKDQHAISDWTFELGGHAKEQIDGLADADPSALDVSAPQVATVHEAAAS